MAKIRERNKGFKTYNSKEVGQMYNAITNRGPMYINRELMPVYIPKEENTIRIVPPLEDDPDMKSFYLDYVAYYINKEAFVSPNIFDTSGEDDPLQTLYKSLRITMNDSAPPELRGTKRKLLFILDTSSDANLDKVMVWAAPPTLIESIFAIGRNRKTGAVENFAHPVHGKDISFDKTGQDVETRYTGISFLDERPLNPKLLDTMEFVRDIIKIPSQSLIQSIIDKYSIVDGADEEDEEEVAKNLLNSSHDSDLSEVDHEDNDDGEANGRDFDSNEVSYSDSNSEALLSDDDDEDAQIEALRRKLEAAREAKKARVSP